MSDPIYVRYTVQKRDALWNLWRKSEMTEAEWVKQNGGRDPAKVLHVGEKIVIKDPIATCEVDREAFHKAAEEVSLMMGGIYYWPSVSCEDRARYNRFKPLRYYTESLSKEEPSRYYEDHCCSGHMTIISM